MRPRNGSPPPNKRLQLTAAAWGVRRVLERLLEWHRRYGLVIQGTESVDALAEEMKRANSLYLWWD